MNHFLGRRRCGSESDAGFALQAGKILEQEVWIPEREQALGLNTHLGEQGLKLLGAHQVPGREVDRLRGDQYDTPGPGNVTR